MVTREEVKNIARLARIEIIESQAEKYQTELSAILDFVGALANADTADIAPIRQITGLESVFRKDEDRGLVDQTIGRELVKQAPSHQDGWVAVPEVIKK